MNRYSCMGTALCILALAACTAAPRPPADAPATSKISGDRLANCFRVSTVNNWRVINDHELVVYGPGRQSAWHVKLFSTCNGLKFTEELGFRARGNSFICGDPGDDLLFPNNQCGIVSVRVISPLEAAALTDPDIRDDIGIDPFLKQTKDK